MSEESFKLWYKQHIWHKYSIGVTLQEKIAGHAKFQYGRHFPRWPPRAILKPICFALKGQQMVEKGNNDNKFYVLSIANAQTMLQTLLICSDPFNMAANIQYGRHRPSCNVIVHYNGNRQCCQKDSVFKKEIYLCIKKVKFIIQILF